MRSLSGLCTEIAGEFSLSWSDLLSLGRWEPAAGFAGTSISCRCQYPAGAGGWGSNSANWSDQSPVYIHSEYICGSSWHMLIKSFHAHWGGSVWNLKPASSQHVFALRKWPKGALDGSLSMLSQKLFPHLAKASQQLRGGAAKPLFGVVFGTTVMLFSYCCATAFDVSSFAMIERC